MNGTHKTRGNKMPSLLGAAFFLCLIAQTGSAQDKQIDLNQATSLAWSTLAAVQHANLSNNFSVLRALSAPTFQQKNSEDRLRQVFKPIRDAAIDLRTTLSLAPQFTISPSIQPDGLLRMRGQFALRPEPVNFDLLFQWSNSQWKLFGIALLTGTEPGE